MSSIILPNNEKVSVDESKTFLDVIENYNPKKLNGLLAVSIDGKSYDLSHKQVKGKLELLTFNKEAGKEIFWHSSAHVMAQAVKRLYPKVQLTIGPVVKSGPGFFYYDILSEEKKFSEDDFLEIEEEIKKIISEDLIITRKVLKKEEAIEKFTSMGENFKSEIVKDIPQESEISVYSQGEFQDLCRGPHVPSTKVLGNFKLTAVAGAYWKGDPNGPVLQRIYAVSFSTPKELKKYLSFIEEAKKRDHRLLGKELDLFSFHDEGPGFPFYHAKGTALFNALADYIREECDIRGYKEIRTPTILSDELWHRSGHYANFKDNMYFTEVDEKGFAIKPMNCPGSNLIYKTSLHSYRELPIKYSELGTVHRHELSGVLHGLFRVRAFTQDDAHIYCTPEQLQEQIQETIDFTVEVYKKFGFENIEIYVATKPEKALGSEEVWSKATTALTDSLKNMSLDYGIKEGEGAFYGPKIEFNIRDSLNRKWQCGTIQVDFSMPERFELEYIDSDSNKKRPVMVHRAILGSLERFMGILLEHYAGKLPYWLSPTQARILTVKSDLSDYANEVLSELQKNKVRVDIDIRNEKIGYKIREWNSQKINYAIVLGDKEKEEKTISIRARGEKDTKTMSIAEFLNLSFN